jgi:hypothetical protein
MDPAIAQANAEYMYYASPNTAVVENEGYIAFLEELHPDAYKILYESSENVFTDSFVNLPEKTKGYMADKWTALGATITEESSNYTVYIVCAVIIAVILAMYIANKIKLYKRKKVDYE